MRIGKRNVKHLQRHDSNIIHAFTFLLLLMLTACTASLNPQQAFDQAFQVYPLPTGYQLVEADSLGNFAKGISFYQQKEYNLAIDYLQRHLEEKQAVQQEANFYLGVALLAKGQASKASFYFNSYLKQDTQFAAATSWYQALAYLRDGRKEGAMLLLTQIAQDSTHPFQQNAASLMRRIN